jgi:membrane-bound inhibitor of C-type lysozyme
MKISLHIIGSAIISLGIIGSSNFAVAAINDTKSKSASKVSKVAPKVIDEDDLEPNVQQSRNIEYKCELGNSLTIYTNAEDAQHVAIRWKNHIHRLTRINTSTGANRFENQKAGFVFIGIPAKGMLLDSHRGKQLANECKTTEPILTDALSLEVMTSQMK